MVQNIEDIDSAGNPRPTGLYSMAGNISSRQPQPVPTHKLILVMSTQTPTREVMQNLTDEYQSPYLLDATRCLDGAHMNPVADRSPAIAVNDIVSSTGTMDGNYWVKDKTTAFELVVHCSRHAFLSATSLDVVESTDAGFHRGDHKDKGTKLLNDRDATAEEPITMDSID